jgi:hypothetical protein
MPRQATYKLVIEDLGNDTARLPPPPLRLRDHGIHNSRFGISSNALYRVCILGSSLEERPSRNSCWADADLGRLSIQHRSHHIHISVSIVVLDRVCYTLLNLCQAHRLLQQ